MMSDVRAHNSIFHKALCVNKLQNRWCLCSRCCCCCCSDSKGFQHQTPGGCVYSVYATLFLPIFAFDAHSPKIVPFLYLYHPTCRYYLYANSSTVRIAFAFGMHNVCLCERCAPACMRVRVWFGFEINSDVMPCKFNFPLQSDIHAECSIWTATAMLATAPAAKQDKSWHHHYLGILFTLDRLHVTQSIFCEWIEFEAI